MRNMKILVLAMTLIIAFASMAMACDGDKAANAAACKSKVEASTASAEMGECCKAAVAAGKEACCKKDAAAASAKTAKAGHCDKAAAAAAGKTCDKASASTAGAKTCDKSAATAGAKGCDKSAATAGAKGCDKSAAAAGSKTCDKAAKAKTASADKACCSKGDAATAGANCSKEAKAVKTAMNIDLSTKRMEDGTLAVYYIGGDEASIAMLHDAVSAGASEFSCGLAKSMVATENCNVEMDKTDNGLVFHCTSDDKAAVAAIEKSYEVAIASMKDATEGE